MGKTAKPSIFDKYKDLVPYRGYIEKSASKYKIGEKYLVAVLLYEMDAWRAQKGYGGDAAAFLKSAFWELKGGETASVGIAQLEIYKARMMLVKNSGDKFANKNKYNAGAIALMLLDPRVAIELAAAYMAHLKEKISYDKLNANGTITKHYLNDWEASLAYCGCSGVTVDGRQPFQEVSSAAR